MSRAEKSASFMAYITLRDWCDIIFFTARLSISYYSGDFVVVMMVERLSLMLETVKDEVGILSLLEKWHRLEGAACHTSVSWKWGILI